MSEIIPAQVRKRFIGAALALGGVLFSGTLGYWIISGRRAPLIDCFYMTFITIATIGFGEVVEQASSPAGRIFTVFLSVAGIGIMTYLLMSLTAFVVEGHMNEAFRRRRMDKLIGGFRDHFIVCGLDGPGFHIVSELLSTGRRFVIVEADRARIDKLLAAFPDTVFVEGDPTDNAVLLQAGVGAARGLFAVTGDDNQNLVASLSAKQLNPGIRVVVSCAEVRNADKMKKAGADSVVSPTFIGGLRMASEMIRPTVVSFLDIMMSRKDESLRVEEFAVPAALAGKPLAALRLGDFSHLLLLAVRHADGWTYNPPRDHRMRAGEVLIFMVTPEERRELEHIFAPTGGAARPEKESGA